MDKLIKTGCLGAFCLLLAACDNPQQTLYYWGNNNADVYERLKSDGKPLGEQSDAMEKYFQKTRSENKKEAPGTHAHLGMLLSEAGQDQSAAEHFETEKRLFPESSAFMDFLLKNKGARK